MNDPVFSKVFFFSPIGLVQPIVMLLRKLREDYIGLYKSFEKKNTEKCIVSHETNEILQIFNIRGWE